MEGQGWGRCPGDGCTAFLAPEASEAGKTLLSHSRLLGLSGVAPRKTHRAAGGSSLQEPQINTGSEVVGTLTCVAQWLSVDL